MRIIPLIALAAMVAFVLLVPMKGQDAQSPDRVQQLVSLSEEARLAALNGDAAWQEAHLAQEFTAIEQDGEMRSRSDAIRMRKEGLVKFDSIVVLERNVRHFGTTAIVLTRANIKAHIGTRDISGGSWLTAVWVKKNGSWMEVASQSTSVGLNP